MNESTTQRAAASTRVLALVAAGAIAAGLLAFGITEEVPVGGIEGKVMLKENGRTLKGVEVYLSPTEEDQNESARRYRLESDEKGRFFVRNMPSGDYTITANAKAHSFDAERVTIGEGGPTVVELLLKPTEPYLNLNASQKVFLPKEQPSFQIDGFLANEKLGIDVYRLNLAEIVKKGSITSLLQAFSRYANSPEDPAKYGTKVRHLDHKVTKQDAEGVFVETLSLDPLTEGFYWIRCRSGKVDQGGYLNVSKIGLVTKSGQTKATAYATDLETGMPVENAAVALSVGTNLKQVGMTSPDGTLNFGVPKGEKQLVVAKKGDSVAVVNFYGNSGDEQNGDGKIFVYSDRPIYKPGDLVQFKGIARKLVGNDFQVPREGTMNAELRDPDDNLVQTFTLPVSTRGTFNGKFSTNKESKPGLYTLLVTGPGGEGRLDVDIASYRKPEFEITVKPIDKFYVFGQRAKVRVKCEYYFGGPVVGAKVNAYVSRAPDWSWTDEDGTVYMDESGSGEGVQDFQVTTDDNGEAIIEFDTTRPKPQEYGSETDYLYTVTVSASEDEKYFEGTGSVRVTRGTFSTSVDTSEYIGQIGQPVDVTVKAESHEDGKPLVGKVIRIVAGEENWTMNKVSFEPLETIEATTGPDGSAKITYTPKKAGSLVFKTHAVDELKNEIESSGYLYVEGAGVPARPGGKLMVTLDKPKYEIGQTAKVLIQTDKPGGFGLLTVEADDVLYQRVINLTQTVTIASMAVEKSFGPNAQVSVAYIKDKQFYEASQEMILKLSEQKLKVELTPDRDKVQPGETVTYTVSTKDQADQPVAADVSLGVVDESIYAIKEDQTNIFTGFFPRRTILVQTSYSFPEIYLDGGDKGGGNIPIRSKFLDTAFWQPTVQTDANGEAKVSVTLPDNLTTWRATAVAVTDKTAVGIGTKEIVASKPLMIRLQTPSYLVVQDEQRISAIVQNDTGQAAEVKVRLQIKGLKLDGDTTQSVRVEPGKPATVEWKATADVTGTAEVIATAEIANGATDGVKHSFEVKPHGREFQEVQAGMIKGQASFDVTVRDGADANTGRLVLNLSPSIATTLVQSLDGLVQFPYGCVEQTMSRFLPAILVDKTLKETGLSRPDLTAKVPAIAADGLTRLARMQHGDGGWGWWEYDESDPFMTALVLDGLQRARAAGFKINESMLTRGLDWAAKRFDAEAGKNDSRRDRVYLCYALAANGRIDDAKKAFKFDFKLAGAPDLALAAMTANLLGPDYADKKSALVGQLKSIAVVTPQTAKWKEEPYAWGQESTALALAALVKLDPGSELIPKTVRYLMSARRGQYWFSTRDTAYVLVGMTAYLRQTKELESTGGTFVVYLNEKELKRVTFDKQSLLKPDLQITVPMKELASGKNTVRIEQSGNAVCYYAADLKQVVPDDKLGTMMNNSDLTVKRTYYRMESRRMEDGTVKLLPSDRPVDEVRSGDVIKVVLSVNSGSDREFVLLEDPVPSNCRVTERDAPYQDEQWGWWWASTVILEDRVAFFARELEAGPHEFSYIMRAEGDGKSNSLPTRVGNMYDPTDIASTSELGLKVNPR